MQTVFTTTIIALVDLTLKIYPLTAVTLELACLLTISDLNAVHMAENLLAGILHPSVLCCSARILLVWYRHGLKFSLHWA